MASKKTHFLHQYTVEGKLPFPIDMLRHDNSFPRGSEDADEISRSIARERDGTGPYRVTLYRASLAIYSKYPTYGRWESFGWKVVAEEL